MTVTITHNNPEEVTAALKEMADKFSSLVWYARSPRSSNVEAWKETTNEIMQRAFQHQMDIEEKYPDEVTRLRDETKADWEHGFNSGCLAAFRFAITALNLETHDYGDDEPDRFGGIEEAQDFFPFLDC